MKIRCIVVDDEHFARKLLEKYIKKLPYLELLGMFKSPLDAMAFLQSQEVDLMFLDIQMPDLKGTDFLRSLRKQPLTIFTTAYQEYALEGYALDVIDYMLKPIRFDRFLEGVNKATARLQLLQKAESTPPPLAQSLQTSPHPNVIILKANHKLYRIHPSDVYYIAGLKEYVTYHTTQGKIIVLDSLKELIRKLPSPQFMRIHRSYIVNTEHVASLYGNQVEIQGTYLPIGKSYVEVVKRQLFPQ